MIAKEYLPPVIRANTLRPLRQLVSKIKAAPRESGEAQQLVEQFNASTGSAYHEWDFRDYDWIEGLDTFIYGALLHPRKFPDIPDAQYLAIFARLHDSECDEAEMNYWIRFLEKNLDCDCIEDIIDGRNGDISDSEMLARAKAQKRTVIILQPPDEP